MRCLLDKVTARYIVQGLLKLAVGVDFVVTFDQPMINQWAVQQMAIQERLIAMKQNLPSPYHQANLPRVLRPEQINA